MQAKDSAKEQGLGRQTIRSMALGGLIALACCGPALFANWMWVRSDPAPLVAELSRSLAEVDGIAGKAPERFNNCLLPLMALLDEGSVRELTVSAQRVYSRQKPQRPCDALEQRLTYGAVDPIEFATTFYHQYWNGHRVVIGALFPLIGVAGYRLLLLALSYGLLALTFMAALWQVARRRQPEEPTREEAAQQQSGHLDRSTANKEWLFFGSSIVVCCLVFALSFDLQRRATSIASGITNLPVFALWFLATVSNPLTWSPRKRATIAALLGCWIVYFSVFTGSILFGGLSLMALAALAPATSDRLRQERATTIFIFAASFCSAVAAFLLLHVVLADIVFEQNIFRFFFDQLAYRIDGSGRSTMQGELNQLYGDHDVSLGRLTQRMERHLFVLGAGSQRLGNFMLQLSTLVLVVALPSFLVLRKQLRDPWRVVGLALSVLAVPLWYGLFLEHTQVHVSFMTRFLAWPLACAVLCLFYLIPSFRSLHWRLPEKTGR